jgi:hypothetical protein
MHTVVVSYLAAAIISVSRSYGSKSRSAAQTQIPQSDDGRRQWIRKRVIWSFSIERVELENK